MRCVERGGGGGERKQLEAKARAPHHLAGTDASKPIPQRYLSDAQRQTTVLFMYRHTHAHTGSTHACMHPRTAHESAPHRTLLLTMLGQVFREEPIGSWSGRGAGASMMVPSCVALCTSVMEPAAAGPSSSSIIRSRIWNIVLHKPNTKPSRGTHRHSRQAP